MHSCSKSIKKVSYLREAPIFQIILYLKFSFQYEAIHPKPNLGCNEYARTYFHEVSNRPGKEIAFNQV